MKLNIKKNKGKMENAISHDVALKHENLVLDEDQEAIVNSPLAFKTSLTPMQKRGLAFCLLRERESKYAQYGGIVCDELGCGKTLFMLSLIYLTLDAEKTRKTLVIAPSSVIHTWKSEIEKHFAFNKLRVGLYYDSKRHNNFEYLWNTSDVIITSYGIVGAEMRYVVSVDDTTGQDIVMNTNARSFAENSFFTFLMETGKMFHRIVLDEAHHMRNLNTKTFMAVSLLKDMAHCKWCVTATPVWNSIDDMWPLIHFLGAFPLADRASWMAEFSERRFTYNTEIVPKLLSFLRPIMIRRDKAELDIPQKTESIIVVPMDESERAFYTALYENSREKVKHLLLLEKWLDNNPLIRTLKKRVSSNILVLFLRMRQSCVHPQVVLDAISKDINENEEDTQMISVRMADAIKRLMGETLEEDCSVCMANHPDHCAVPCGHRLCGDCFAIVEAMINSEFRCPFCRQLIERYLPVEHLLKEVKEEQETGEPALKIECEWAKPSSKMRFIMEDMTTFPPGTKFVIFSQWVSVLNIMGRHLLEKEIPFLRIDGTMSLLRRKEVQRMFQEEEKHNIMLISLMAGSEGLNLQRASVVYFLDVWWTASRVDQASNRVHRLGQWRNVHVKHLVSQDTLEERALEIQSKKRKIGHKIFGKAEQAELVRFAFNL